MFPWARSTRMISTGINNTIVAVVKIQLESRFAVMIAELSG